MVTRVGINGFGRIGRSVFRLASEDPEIEVVKINDLSPPSTLVHLIKYDSVHGKFNADLEANEQGIRVGQRQVLCSSSADPTQIDWSEAKVDIVLECTGKFRDRTTCEQYLKNGAKKVIISAPGKNDDVTIVMGVNQEKYDSKAHKIISNASCTTNCLAPVAMVLDQNFKIRRGFMTTVHSYTNDQRILCGAHKDLRRARAANLAQIPTTTGGAKAIGLVLPHLKGKLNGMAIRVPTPNVSLIDLVVEVEKSTSAEEINAVFAKATKTSLRGILDYSDEPLVSIDYNGSTFSAIVDGLSTSVLEGNMLKVLAWYDNEIGFSQRMIDLAKFVGKTL